MRGRRISWGELGDRMSVFEKKAPHCLYLPGDGERTAKGHNAVHACGVLGAIQKPTSGGVDGAGRDRADRRLNPSQGYGHQRVFTEDGEIDETCSFNEHDAVLVPKGHHSCGAPYGYELYYLNVMAGPLRKWRFQNHPDHNGIYERDHSPS